MKHLWQVPLALLVHLAVDAARLGSSHHPRHFDGTVLASRRHDFISCNRTAAKFLGAPMPAADAIERAADFCAVDKRLLHSSYACKHFEEGITRALQREPKDKLFDSAAFCQATESYMLDIRGAARVPRTGTGSLLDFKVSPRCARAVAAAFAPARRLAAGSVPDFWWAMCMNQDCAHFLPSRTRWCGTQRQPTHSAMVCEAARSFALGEVLGHDGDMSPDQICALYADFVKAMGVGVEAYEHVMHNDTAKKLPVPDDQVRTLLSSRMLNDAKAHYIRDHLSSPIEQAPGSYQRPPPSDAQAAHSRGRGMADRRAASAQALLALSVGCVGMLLNRA